MNYGMCMACNAPLKKIEKNDEFIVEFQCTCCSKKWTMHLNEDGIVTNVVVTDKDGEVVFE